MFGTKADLSGKYREWVEKGTLSDLSVALASGDGGLRTNGATGDRMNGTQCRMARVGLGWSLDDLAAATEMSKRTIIRHEWDQTVLLSENAAKLRAAFEAAGVVFIERRGHVGATVPRAPVEGR